ncbi:hypothetical protein E3J62_00125 [candidate division TA06 bacterium]|uniref:Pyrrolo-quinoline quinone repeat domain-containing protein n=1 Tax=candidate division TA06 bacterium TaxID=2250710 RepID=A0A523UZI7_UNCT6|nr:MAG: hypothetical protein E3J62_00125 [candidate division TA06 bacterium]
MGGKQIREAALVRVAGISTILILLLGVGSVAPQKVGGREGHEVTLELVWQREFEEEVIAGVLGQNGIIVITEDSIYRVDTTKGEFESLRPTYEGSKEPRWRRSWVHPAANGKFICLRHGILVDEPSGKSGTPHTQFVQIEVIDDGGERLWDLPLREVDPYGEYIFYGGGWISSEGYVVVTDEDTMLRGKLLFYDATGERISDIVYSTSGLDFGASRKGAFSADGQYFVFCGKEGFKAETDSPSYLLLTDKFGKLLWKDTKKTRSEGYGYRGVRRELAISSRGSYVAATTFRTLELLIFDKAGNLLWRKELPIKYGLSALSFTPDEQTILVSYGRNLEVFVSATGERLWHGEIQGPAASLPVATEGTGQFHVLASGSELVLVDESGKLSEGTKLIGATTESKTRGRIYPALSSYQNRILIVFPNQVYLYRIRKD